MTVTQVQVTYDMKSAKIYISFLKNKKTVNELMQILIAKKKMIRHYVALRLKLKYIPDLYFYYDDRMEHAEKIDRLIN